MSKEKKDLEKESIEKLEKIKKATENRNEDMKGSNEKKELKDKLKGLKDKLAKCEEELEEQKDLNMRLRAEFDNYKRRSQKEKGEIRVDSIIDVMKILLPVIDNFERALELETDDIQSFKDGVNMIYRQLIDLLKKCGVEEIKALGEKFDPMLHNAVMHIEDDDEGDNVVVDEFQKGYKIADKVIRHSMVKVAN